MLAFIVVPTAVNLASNYISAEHNSIVLYIQSVFAYWNRTLTLFAFLMFLLSCLSVIGAILLFSPQSRLWATMSIQKALTPFLREGSIVGLDGSAHLASSVIVFATTESGNKLRYYTLLQLKDVENVQVGGKENAQLPIYPGKRVRVWERPDLAAVEHVRTTLGLKNVALSGIHHDLTTEKEFPGVNTREAPCPFLVLIERQPQRGPGVYNYDLIYVANYRGEDSGRLDPAPEGCVWRSVSDILDDTHKDLLPDVRAAYTQAIQILPQFKAEAARTARRGRVRPSGRTAEERPT